MWEKMELEKSEDAKHRRFFINLLNTCTLETDDYNDANFVVNGGTSGATSEDKVGIMIAIAFPLQ